MKKALIMAAVMAAVSCGHGPWHKTRGGFVADGQLAKVEVTCFTPEIVRVVKSPLYAEPVETTSESVTLERRRVKFSVTEPEPGKIVLSTASMRVLLDLGTCALSFEDASGNLLTSENTSAVPMSPSGDSFKVSQGFSLAEGEAIYGLGQHKRSGLNQRGRSYRLENANTEIAIPLVHSSKGYALFWDNYSPTFFSSGDDGFGFRSDCGNCCDYYVLYGGDADGVVKQIRTLTGEAPMNPLWAFGFHQSRERYASGKQLVGVVRKYRELGVPLDGIIQDWQYWGDHAHWNAVEFLNPAYPDPVGMMEKVHSMGAHALISVWPSFGPETDIFKDLQAEDLLLPLSTFPQGNGVKVYDPWDPRAREIFWSYMEKYLWGAGIDGWWLDATEPEHQPVKPEDYDYVTPEGTYREMRNSFPLFSVGGVYDHQRAHDPSRRVMILTRSASAGLQRYGAHVWSGDLEANWSSLRDQITSALNMSLCGIPYHNSDIGGFYCNGSYPGGNQNPAYRKLYDRWMQLAVFTGMMRSHGTHTPREIFQFGERGSEDFDSQEASIRLRYALLPYIYSQAWKVTSEGASLMRPLFALCPGDAEAASREDEFLFGESILVAPVLSEEDEASPYLPAGEWIDFFGGNRLVGGMSFRRDVSLDEIPVYVKAGTVLPVGPDVQYASEKPWDSLQVRIYTGADGDFTLYEDEGDGYGYEKGRRSEIRFHWSDAEGRLTIAARKGSFPGMLQSREFRVVLVRPGAGTGLDIASCDAKVAYEGREVSLDLNTL